MKWTCNGVDRSPGWITAALLLTGCAARGELPTPTRGALYDVAILSGSGVRWVSSMYTLDAERGDRDVWVISTTHSQGTWDEGGSAIAFDSNEPRSSDPWPLILQHTVSAVPAPILFDASGTPVEMVDPTSWSGAATAAILQLDLPKEAMPAGDALIDPVGVVADLQRNFTGAPPPEGPWTRDERMAGLAATRTERCTHDRRGSTTTWTCTGTIAGPTAGPARLHEGTCWTTLVIDGKGLVSLEGGYAATMVMLDPGGSSVVDRPVVGKRLVKRR